jgi:transcriptional regulator with PAS, ATPase and Fis domain
MQRGSPQTASTAGAQLILVACGDEPLAGSVRHSLEGTDEVSIGRGPARRCERRVDAGLRRLVLGVPDRRVSTTHASLSRSGASWRLEDPGSKNGTLINGQRQLQVQLHSGDLIEVGNTFFLFRDDVPVHASQSLDLDATKLTPPTPELATFVAALAEDYASLAQVARSSISVLAHGDTGTGKEILAHAVHSLSGRSGAFMAVNCGAIPENLIEAELFGYRKGAFSGAVANHSGLVLSAHGGTLFLDEIGDLDAASQAALLRVLEEREVMALGSTQSVKVDVRLVAATHRDLEAMVEKKRFRRDLLARLKGFTLILPPLNERREDLGLIMAALIRRVAPARAAEVRFDPLAVRALLRYSWPDNIRELKQALEAAIVLAGDGVIELRHLPAGVRKPPPEPVREGQLDAAEQQQRDQLVALLGEHRGNLTTVARALGKDRVQIRRWMKRYGLDVETFKKGKST